MGNHAMSKYSLEVITDQKKSDQFLPRVRVIENINTFADLANDQIILQMAKWCEENECGYRTSYNTFKFRNKDQLTMFILRWS
jgi:hypothetical protein